MSYQKLAAINVNDKLEKKNGLSYLSWAWAVDQLMRTDPDASWEYGEPKMYADTMMVFCTVTAFGKLRTAFLPVMDYKNKPIPHPNAFEVNTAMQRCLVKAIALHGLGLYVYAGEDLPPGEDGEAQTKDEKPEMRSASPSEVKRVAFESMPKDEQEFLRKIAADVSALISEDRAYDAYGFWINQKLDTEEMVAIQSLWDSKERSALTKAASQWKLANNPNPRDNHRGATPQERAAA